MPLFTCPPLRTPADRVFGRRAQITAVVCFLFYLALSQTSMRFPQGPVHTTLGGISGVFFLGELIACGLLLYRRFDEFQRTLLLRSFLWANLLTLCLATVWGFVELAAHSTTPHIPYLVLPATLILLTAFIKVLIFRRNRSLPEITPF